MQAERPLYRHQEQSIKHVFKGRNIVVATGTGSGKTESFLNPILLDLTKSSKRDRFARVSAHWYYTP